MTSLDLRRPRRVATAPPVDSSGGPGRRAAVALTAVAATLASLAALVAAALVGGAAAPPALADPGPLTRWGILIARVGYDVSALATIGLLVVAVVLLPTTAKLSPDASRLVRTAGRWAVAWCVTALLSVPFTLSDVAGVPLADTLAPDILPLALDLPQTRALLSSAWLAGLVVMWSHWARSAATARLLLVTALGALLPLILTGHAGHGEQHALAVTGLAVHVTAASVWLGGLLALAVCLRRSPAALAAALPRYSRAALGCFILVALSGTVAAWATLGEPGDLLSTPYGQLLLAKVAALALLGAIGHRHRRRTLTAAAAHRPRAFLALAAVELVVMAATAGLAVGLSRTAPPDTGGHTAAAGCITVEHSNACEGNGFTIDSRSAPTVVGRFGDHSASMPNNGRRES